MGFNLKSLKIARVNQVVLLLNVLLWCARLSSNVRQIRRP